MDESLLLLKNDFHKLEIYIREQDGLIGLKITEFGNTATAGLQKHSLERVIGTLIKYLVKD